MSHAEKVAASGGYYLCPLLANGDAVAINLNFSIINCAIALHCKGD
jgi:hypothetical protein